MNFFILYFLIFIIWGNVYYLYRYSAKKDKCAPIDDIGVFWSAVLALYSTLPVISWIIQGYNYISILSPRLLEYQPDINDVNYLLLIAACYSIGFTLVFKFYRKKIKSLQFVKFRKIQTPIIFTSFIILVFIKFVLFFSSTLFGIGLAESYIDQYRVIQEAPLIVKQFLKYLLSFQPLAIIIIMIWMFQNWKKNKIYFYIFLLFTLFSFDPEGGRAAIATTFLAIFFLWNVLVKKISSRVWLIISTFGVTIFLVFGLLRGVQGLSDYDLTGYDNPGVGEFDAIWANAVHLNKEKKYGNLNVPATVRFGELWEFFPSQLLPFDKRSLSVWYLDTYFADYKKAGGGWAFGAISQAVIGFGPIEALFRGMILGALYGFLMYWYRKSINVWWSIPFYLSMYLFSFSSIRDTTFTQLSVVLQNLIPGLLIIYLISKIFIKPKQNKILK